MKLNPNKVVPDSPEDETFKRLKRAPYSEALEIFYRQFGFNPISSEELDRLLEEKGWAYDDFFTEFINKGTRNFTDGDETIVVTITQLTSS